MARQKIEVLDETETPIPGVAAKCYPQARRNMRTFEKAKIKSDLGFYSVLSMPQLVRILQRKEHRDLKCKEDNEASSNRSKRLVKFLTSKSISALLGPSMAMDKPPAPASLLHSSGRSAFFGISKNSCHNNSNDMNQQGWSSSGQSMNLLSSVYEDNRIEMLARWCPHLALLIAWWSQLHAMEKLASKSKQCNLIGKLGV
ncbi:hypothetical protein T265_01132 [Opisthorchis viverrini]|uniref:Uncharacterized protein n=1 Tax=Opisthorchis viverrini TaxID=6198 RepID=A0A075A3J8_OPIVI|nr:hypothetical protein T265_01132 [Opisthorchis viverrini]KER32842.1 hypothetical protein T265_01132 [Opisthorchis viverrini]